MFINTIGMTEVLFTNYEFSKHESPTKGRVAPGSLVFCIAEGLLTQSTMQGVGLAFLNMTLDIKGPTFAGDTIHVECEVIESRRVEEPPGMRPRAHAQSRRQAGRHASSWNTRRCAS